MAVEKVWEYIPGDDILVEHSVKDGDLRYTDCDKQTWSPETDPSVDPDGVVGEDVWFSDHDRPDAIRLCEACAAARAV